MNIWNRVATVEEIPLLGSRVVASDQGNIAIFRNGDGDVFAMYDKCPHKGGPLSQGIVFARHVTCPLHGWNISLEDGRAVEPDKGCANIVACKVENGEVFLRLA